jgi:hypothetical protein
MVAAVLGPCVPSNSVELELLRFEPQTIRVTDRKGSVEILSNPMFDHESGYPLIDRYWYRRPDFEPFRT